MMLIDILIVWVLGFVCGCAGTLWVVTEEKKSDE